MLGALALKADLVGVSAPPVSPQAECIVVVLNKPDLWKASVVRNVPKDIKEKTGDRARDAM